MASVLRWSFDAQFPPHLRRRSPALFFVGRREIECRFTVQSADAGWARPARLRLRDELRFESGISSGRRIAARLKGSSHYSIAVAGPLRTDRPGQPADAGRRTELGLGRSRAAGRALQGAGRIAEGCIGGVSAAAPAGQPSAHGTAAPHACRRCRNPRPLGAMAQTTRAADLVAAPAPLRT